jgi:hypothetical protein
VANFGNELMNMKSRRDKDLQFGSFKAELGFLTFTLLAARQRELQTKKTKKGWHMYMCLDPPKQQRGPRVKLEPLGTKPPVSDSASVPSGNSGANLTGIHPHSQAENHNLLRYMYPKTTICRDTPVIVKPDGISAGQRRLLQRFDEDDRTLALLLALHGELTKEHLEKAPHDDWEAEVLRQANKN